MKYERLNNCFTIKYQLNEKNTAKLINYNFRLHLYLFETTKSVRYILFEITNSRSYDLIFKYGNNLYLVEMGLI